MVALPIWRVAGGREVGDALYDEILYPMAHCPLQLCHAVLRLPGESKGADHDVKLATERGLPVYFRLEDVPRLD